MILPDHEIKKFLKEGKISIEPLKKEQIKSACVDLSLSSELRIFKHTDESCIDCFLAQFQPS